MESQDSCNERGQLLGLPVARPAARSGRGRRSPNAERPTSIIPSSRRPTAAATSCCCATPTRSSRRSRRSPASTSRGHPAAPDAPAELNQAAPANRRVAPHRSRSAVRQRRRRRQRPSAPGRASIARSARTRGEIAVCSRRGSRRARPQHGGAIRPRDGRARRQTRRALLRRTRDRFLALSRPLPEQCLHRRRLCRAHARDPRHHGRPLAAAAISRG